MDRLWTPWRYSYITGADTTRRKGIPPELSAWPPEQERDLDKGCVFCNLVASANYAISSGMAAEAADRAARIVLRGTFCYVCLNAFPYASGHVLIVPYTHLDSLANLPAAAAEELIHMAQRIESALRLVYRPDGINMGLNLGQAAGAGVAEHLHLHALPRWAGDTNFMTVTGETRIIPELLDTTWRRLYHQLHQTPQ
jgi:ATP adenylyltransferase